MLSATDHEIVTLLQDEEFTNEVIEQALANPEVMDELAEDMGAFNATKPRTGTAAAVGTKPQWGKPLHRFIVTGAAIFAIGVLVLTLLPPSPTFWDTALGGLLLTASVLVLLDFYGLLGWATPITAFKPTEKERTSYVITHGASVPFDINELRRVRLQLTEFAVDRCTDAAFWMTKDARYFYVNDVACRMLGYSREELLSMTVQDIDPDFPVEAWPVHWEDLRRTGSLTFESRHRSEDGRIFPVQIVANYLLLNGQEYNIEFARDITERKRTEQELTGAMTNVEELSCCDSSLRPDQAGRPTKRWRHSPRARVGGSGTSPFPR